MATPHRRHGGDHPAGPVSRSGDPVFWILAKPGTPCGRNASSRRQRCTARCGDDHINGSKPTYRYQSSLGWSYHRSGERTLTADEVTVLGNALLAKVFELSIPNIRRVVATAGIDAGLIPATSEARGGQGSRAEVVPAVQRLFTALPHERKERSLPILADQILMSHHGTPRDEVAAQLDHLLAQHGFRYDGERFSPVNTSDEREREFLPPASYDEISDGFGRLADGDESGAITKVCGAVDTLTQALYANHGDWGPVPNSFQTRVNISLKKLNVFETMKHEFIELGITEGDATTIVEEIRQAMNHAAQALQVIRRTMGDVHGTRRALRKTAYDSIKWASAICGLLEGEA